MDKNIYEVGIIEHRAFDEIKQLFAENKIDPASTGLVRENYLIYLKPGVEAGPNEAIWEIPNTSIYGLYNDNAYKKNLEDAANHLIETQNISKMWLMLYSPKTKLKFHWDFFKNRHLVSLNEKFIEMTLGFFLIALIPIRRWMRNKNFYLKLWQMSLVGAGIGYLTGIVATTGAINTPFFLAYGLSKGAFLGTEAASTLSILFTKGITFHQLGFLNAAAIVQGLFIGIFVNKSLVIVRPKDAGITGNRESSLLCSISSFSSSESPG